MRGAAASDADRVHLRHFLRHCQQRRHRAERTAHVVLIESRGDDADTGIGELHADVDDAGIEELDLVDADDLHADLDARQQLGAGGHGVRFQPAVIARDDFVGGETVVEDRLEDLHPLPRDDRPAQPPDQLLRFSGEHASGDDFDPAAAMMVQRGSSERTLQEVLNETSANFAIPSRIRASLSFANVSRIVFRPLPSTKNGPPGM